MNDSNYLDLAQFDLLDDLERLDDSVWSAVQGDTEALDLFRQLWPKLSRSLPEHVAAESRAQYLRYAMQVWQMDKHPEGRGPAALAALEVLTILLDGQPETW